MSGKIGKILLIFSLSLLLLSGSCTLPDQRGEFDDGIQILIGMALSDLSDPWQISLYAQMKEELKKRENANIIFRNAARSTYTQIKDIDTMLAYGIDVLVIIVNDENVLKPVIKEVEKKIPVILLDRPLDDQDYSLYIGPDYDHIGQQAGEEAIRDLEKEGGSVVELFGSFESPSSQEMSRGFRETIRNSEGVRIVASFEADWQRDRAEDLLAQYLEKNGKVDLLFAHNDAMAVGAYHALKEKGIHGVKIIGVGKWSDQALPAPEWTKSDMIDTRIMYPLGGKEAIDYAVQLANHRPNIPKKMILRSFAVQRQEVQDSPIRTDEQMRWDQSARKAGGIRIGWIGKGVGDPWDEAIYTSIRNAVIGEGFDLLVGEQSQPQITIMQKMIAEKVDLILLSPILKKGWDPILREARMNHIPVFLIQGEVEAGEGLWLSYIGSDDRDRGMMAARWMVEHLYNGKEDLRIAEVISTQGSSETEGKIVGFNEVIKGYSNIRITAWGISRPDIERGKEAVRNILADPARKVNAIFAHNDALALGAVKAVEEAGLMPGKEVSIITIGGTEASLRALHEGKISMIVKTNLDIGPQVMEVMKGYMRGETPPLKMINMDQVLEAARYRE